MEEIKQTVITAADRRKCLIMGNSMELEIKEVT